MARTQKPPEDKKTSLAPLTFDKALSGLLATEPPAKASKRRQGGAASTPKRTPSERDDAPKIELLYFAECPNYLRALTVLRDVVASLGMVASVDLVAVETQVEAERQGFYGSPTIRVNGVDIVPPDPTAQPALACRVYRTAQGALTPIPPIEAIIAALPRG